MIEFTARPGWSVLLVPDDQLRSLYTTHNQITAYDRNIQKGMIEILTPFVSAATCVQSD